MVRTAVVLASMAVLGACASAAPEEGAANRVAVEVVNDILPPTDVAIYAVHDRGSRTLLGTAAGNDETSFDFQAIGGSYRLIAESRVSGAEYVSPSFTPIPPESFVWRMRGNLLSPTDGGGSAR